jgi:hypothetical protein
MILFVPCGGESAKFVQFAQSRTRFHRPRWPAFGRFDLHGLLLVFLG